MTHADILIELIAEHAKITIEEARFAFGTFRAVFPSSYDLDRELSDSEAASQLNLYRSNPDLMQWISEVMKAGPGKLPTA